MFCSFETGGRKITPQDIIETRGNKIVWPYSNITIINSKVWEEWLLYLIIRSIENKSNLENKNFMLLIIMGINVMFRFFIHRNMSHYRIFK